MTASPITEPRSGLVTKSAVVVAGLIAPLVFFTCCLILSRWLTQLSERFSGYTVIIAYVTALFGGTLLMWRGIGQEHCAGSLAWLT